MISPTRFASPRAFQLTTGTPAARGHAIVEPSAVLLACLREPAESQRTGSPCDLAGKSIDWRQVLALAARHRVRPLLFARLQNDGPSIVPPEVLGTLGAFATANARRNLLLTGELLELLHLLRSHNIPAAPFKGPVLAAMAHGSTAMREAGDLDVLVRRQDIVRAKRLLVSRGFSPVFPTATARQSAWLAALCGSREVAYLTSHAEHHLARGRGPVNIDLHWALALREFHLLQKPRELWEWLSPQPFAGQTVNTFGPGQLLLVLCINGAKDCWQRLDRVCDIAALLERYPVMNGSRLLSNAQKIGCARILLLGLRLAADLLGARPPADLVALMQRDPAVQSLAARAAARLFVPCHDEVEAAGAWKAIFHLQMRERLHDRLGYGLRMFEPTVGDWSALPLPPCLSSLHYLTRPARLMIGAFRHMQSD